MAKTTIPVELSSTPGITDNSNATAITIDSSEAVTFAGDVQAPGLYVGSTNTGYDFYNNGTSYLNGNVTIDADLTLTSSGGIFLGGTGSANKLTDYEEGTWTPTINDGVIASATGRYTKIGRMVTVTYNYTLTTLGSSNSMLIVGGLPFTSANNAPGSVGSVLCRYFTKNQIVSYVDYNASVITYYNNSSANFDQVSHGEVEASYDNDFEATGTHTYFT
tara:strand:+ start:3278 stop:3934 length:657 start_codon:yes stop_codon:yes gene_type:complete